MKEDSLAVLHGDDVLAEGEDEGLNATDLVFKQNGNRTCELPCSMLWSTRCRGSGGLPCMLPRFEMPHGLHYCGDCVFLDDGEEDLEHVATVLSRREEGRASAAARGLLIE